MCVTNARSEEEQHGIRSAHSVIQRHLLREGLFHLATTLAVYANHGRAGIKENRR